MGKDITLLPLPMKFEACYDSLCNAFGLHLHVRIIQSQSKRSRVKKSFKTS